MEIYFLTVWRLDVQDEGVVRVAFILRPLCSDCKRPSFPVSPPSLSSVPVCVLIFSSCKGISHIGLDPTQRHCLILITSLKAISASTFTF